MTAELDVAIQDSTDRYLEGETPEDRGSRLLYDGAEASVLWGDMVKVATDISGMYSFDPLGGEGFDPTLNSNSFVGSVLHHVGIEIEGNEPLGEGTAPGAYNLLGTSVGETLQTEGQTVVLFGGRGNDVLLGDERANHLSGGAGDDIFRPGGGGTASTVDRMELCRKTTAMIR